MNGKSVAKYELSLNATRWKVDFHLFFTLLGKRTAVKPWKRGGLGG